MTLTGGEPMKSQQYEEYEGQGQGVAVLSMGGDLDLSRTEEIGRAIQRAELPRRLPEIPGVEVATFYQPAGGTNEVGGDFYDCASRLREGHSAT